MHTGQNRGQTGRFPRSRYLSHSNGILQNNSILKVTYFVLSFCVNRRPHHQTPTSSCLSNCRRPACPALESYRHLPPATRHFPRSHSPVPFSIQLLRFQIVPNFFTPHGNAISFFSSISTLFAENTRGGGYPSNSVLPSSRGTEHDPRTTIFLQFRFSLFSFSAFCAPRLSIFRFSRFPYPLPSSVSRNFFVSHSYAKHRGGGVLPNFEYFTRHSSLATRLYLHLCYSGGQA